MNFLSFTKIASVGLFIVCAATLPLPQFSAAKEQIKFFPPSPVYLGRRTPSDQAYHCRDRYPEITALVPAHSSKNQWGLTVSDHPTIWFNVASGIRAGTLVEWRLRNQQGKTIYKVASRLPKTEPGVVGFSVPETVPIAIATYQWDLAIYCNSATASGEPIEQFDRPLIRRGVIQRVALSPKLRQGLAIAKTPLERANQYAESGIWYDALTTLGQQMRSSQTQEIRAAWNSLLNQQKLEGASTTVTSCCK
jgi:hypothetical protein